MATEGYTVNNYGDNPPDIEFPSAVLVESVRYPPEDTPGAVVTELGLWQVPKNIACTFSLSYCRSVFNRAPDYNIILQQTSPIKLGNSVRNFVLHETDDFERSRTAFVKIRETTKPLVDDCSILLTESLLEEIILPQPVEPSHLVHHLVEVMDSNPDAHTDWVGVLRSLTLSAIGQDKSEDVQELLDKGVSMGSTDSGGNTILHRAAEKGSLNGVTSKLSEEEKKKVLSKTNQEGKQPLHVAFEKDKPHAVVELVNSGAKISATSENQDESNPLHLAAEAGSNAAISATHHKKSNLAASQKPDNPERQEFLNALNAKNKTGYTPLMIAIQNLKNRKNYLESTVSLLQAGADPNIQHPESGDTALHYAAKKGNAVLTKALIAFRSDVSIVNKAGNTALQEAMSTEGAEESRKVLQESTNHLEKVKATLAESVEPASLDPDSIALLSLDGGGSRGLISCQIMITLQRRMRELDPNCALLHKYFDYIAGTSAGGIFATYMVYNDADAESALTTVFKAVNELLSNAPTIPADVADLSAQETVGSSTNFDEVQKPRVIVTTCRANQKPPALELIRNYAQPCEGKVWKTWEAIRATSAAPVYFPPYGDYIDGGLVANNPTLDAMAEIVKQSKKESGKLPKFGMVVSIGTGMSPPIEVKDIQVFVPKLGNFFKSVVQLPDTISALHSVINLALSQSTQSNGQEVERACAWCESMGVPYHRLSPVMKKAVDLSEDDMNELVEMLYIAYLYSLKNIKELDRIARLLLSRSIDYEASDL